MEEKIASSSISAQKNAAIGQSETVAREHRQAYGTAKTENLRTSDLWRILLPTFVILCGLALIVVPLVILIPLLSNSIAAIGDVKQSSEAQLLWVWITMIVLEMALCAVIARWIFSVFFSQKTSYQH
jgi:NADH:ubiquinone oxidoreductase subunit 5 (subunit L)/multisubunit Na+/H+ antiporter MnhA subunit